MPISTDTAVLLGVLALVGPRCPDQLRVFLLALAIVDDIGAVLAIALFYTDEVDVVALLVAVGLFAALLGLRFVHFWRTPVYVVIGVAMWLAVLRSGVHPSVVGVAMGLLVNAYAPRRYDIARVQVTGPQLPRRPDGGPRRRGAGGGDRGGLAERAAAAADPAVEQLRDRAAVRAGERRRRADGGDAARGRGRRRSPGASWSGSWSGKPIGVIAGTWVALRTRLGAVPDTLRWGQLIGGAGLSGIGFTVALFVTELALHDEALVAQAKIGILAGLRAGRRRRAG